MQARLEPRRLGAFPIKFDLRRRGDVVARLANQIGEALELFPG
jgi:hypothetical protein